MSDETVRFNKAIDLFFGMNPAKRYWILLALYFAKNRKLHVIDNYTGDGFEMARVSADIVNCENDWKEKGITSRTVVADVANDQKDLIDEIYYGFDVDAISYLGKSKTDSGFWGTGQMEPTYLVEVAETLISLSDEWYEEHAQWAFDIILRRAMRNIHEFGGVFAQSNELTSLALRLLDAHEGSVYNPYAGICSFGAQLDPNCSYYGQEMSINYVLGKLNLLYNGKSNAVCEKEDSAREWKNQGFDYIVAVPPFGLRAKREYRTVEQDFLFRSARDARRKAIGIYPVDIFLSNNRIPSQELRKLVDDDVIEGVILLPNNIFVTTGIVMVMIIVNKQKERKNFIRFVDASDCYNKNGRYNQLCWEKIVELYQKGSEKSVWVSTEDVMSNGCKLYPKRYTEVVNLEAPDGMRALRLSEVLKPLRRRPAHSSVGPVFYRVRHKVNADGIINVSDLDIRDLSGLPVNNAVCEDCLVIGRLGNFSASYLKTNGQEVFLNSMYWPFRVDTSVIAPAYLLSEMSKDYFAKQLARYGSSLFPLFSRDEFLDMTVFVPLEREQQLSMSTEYVEQRIKAIEAEQERKFQKKYDDFVLNQRQRKHAVAQVLNEILPSIENIEGFIRDNDTVSKDSVVSRRFGTTLQEYLASVHEQFYKVATMVDNFTRQEKYGQPENVNLEGFLKEYSSSKRTADINVVYVHRVDTQISQEEVEQEVKISPEDLTQMLDNLVTNAVKYGFTDENRKDYEIRIETSAIYDDKEPIVIKVANNGNPVSGSITLAKLFTWGIGQGSGIGCWQVKEIAEHYGGTASYQEFPDDPEGFVCEFSIVLPYNED